MSSGIATVKLQYLPSRLSSLSMIRGTGAEIWLKELVGSLPVGIYSWARGITVGADGNLVVVGITQENINAGTDSDIFVIKLDPDANELWVRVHSSNRARTGIPHDYLSSVTTDPLTGNIVACGSTFGAWPGQDQDYLYRGGGA